MSRSSGFYAGADELIKFWKQDLSDEAHQFTHPTDRGILREFFSNHLEDKITSVINYIDDRRGTDEKDRLLNLSLFPLPFIGDIRRASVFLLMLNPGLSPIDYYAEFETNFRSYYLQPNLTQQGMDEKFPFMFLNPAICWHSGYTYWEKKFRSIAQILATRKFDGSYIKALSYLAQNVVCLQLVPYHSRAFGGHAIIQQLESVKAIRDFVSNSLVPEAYSGRIKILVMRQSRNWGILETCSNIQKYEGAQARSASLKDHQEWIFSALETEESGLLWMK